MVFEMTIAEVEILGIIKSESVFEIRPQFPFSSTMGAALPS